MGWALQHLTANTRAQIARKLFKVESEDPSEKGLWLNGLCPLHEDSNASFGYNVDQDVYHCLAACSDDGDLVDLWCLVNGFGTRSREGFNAFRRQHAEEMGVGSPSRKTPAQLKPKDPSPPPKARTAIPEEVYQTFERIPDDMASELRIRRGWSRDAIEALGVRVLSHYRKKESLYTLYPIKARDRVVIPIRDNKGVIWNLRCYYPFGLPANATEKTRKIISWGKGHGHARLFPAPSMLRDSGPIVLVEGEADCICAHSQGINAITQTSKTTNYWPEDQLKAVSGRKVVIAYDADQAGQNYAVRTAVWLQKAGCQVHILEWPDYMGRQPDGSWPEDHGQDLTDYFVKHGKDIHAFNVLVENAPPFNAETSKAPEEQLPQPWLAFFGMSASGRFTFRERALADWLLKNCPMLYHDRSGQLYRWEGSYFEPWSEEQLRRAAIEALGEEATASRVNSSCSIAMSLVSMPHGRDINDRPEWVCLQNGMFNLYTLELQPHDPDFLATIKLGVKWHFDEEALKNKSLPALMEQIKPVRWLQYLDEAVMTPEVIMQLQEYAGYCLTRETKFGKSLLLLGPGSDGKSKFIAILRALVGPQNCSAVSMSGLDDQFQRAALFGKILNVATEITTDAIQSEMFKAVVTGDPIQASFKHKDSFEFVPFCKLVYASNKMPRVFDNSDGYFRRLLPVLFKRQFLEDDAAMDPDLEEKLLGELDGIFAWAVIGLHRLIQQKRFTTATETLDFMMRYRRYNNPVMAFVQDKCVLDNKEAETPLKDLYKAYKEYCTEGGFRPANRENFFEELQTAVRKLREDAAVRRHRPRRGNDRPDLIIGISLNFNADIGL